MFIVEIGKYRKLAVWDALVQRDANKTSDNWLIGEAFESYQCCSE